MIVEVVGKTIPNFTLQEEGQTLTMILNVEDEASAKDIDLDFSETELKLNSANYELKYDFVKKKGFKVEPESVQAKFNKAKKTLTLVFQKKN